MKLEVELKDAEALLKVANRILDISTVSDYLDYEEAFDSVFIPVAHEFKDTIECDEDAQKLITVVTKIKKSLKYSTQGR